MRHQVDRLLGAGIHLPTKLLSNFERLGRWKTKKREREGEEVGGSGAGRSDSSIGGSEGKSKSLPIGPHT